MRRTLLRVLKHGLPTAMALAVLGYLMAEVAGVWLAGHPTPRPDAGPAPAVTGEDVARTLRTRVPLAMAAWGFGLVLVFEVVLSFWRGTPAPVVKRGLAIPSEDEVEQLLNELLRQAEAAEASRAAAAAAKTPPDPPCPPRPPADNVSVSN